MRLFVFGAGATRGASFVKIKNNACLPPLDGDFFTQLQRIKNPKHEAIIKNVIKDVTSLFGTNFQLTLETVFSTLENIIRMVKTAGEKRDFRVDELENMRINLLQAIAAVLEESLAINQQQSKKKNKSSLKHQECKFHAELIKLFNPSDSLISFNYDCLLDDTLKDHGNNKWNAQYGYGFPLRKNGGLKGYEHWQPKNPSSKNKTIKLFKLHGSLHFRFNGRILTLKERPYTRQKGNLQFEIIPPEVKKDFDEDGSRFSKLWKQAGSAIHKAKTLVIIGYSFPRTDLHSTALFRVSLNKKGLDRLIIVNPDKQARLRTREVLVRGISSKTRVMVFDSLSELIDGKILE